MPGAKAFVPRRWPDAAQAIALIHEAGGVAVIAHPYWDISEPDRGRRPDPLLGGRRGRDLLPNPHRGADRATCSTSAPSSSLIPTASSDYHGPTHKTFAKFGAYDTYGLGEPQVPPKP